MTTPSGQAHRLSQAARNRLLRAAQPLGHRQCAALQHLGSRRSPRPVPVLRVDRQGRQPRHPGRRVGASRRAVRRGDLLLTPISRAVCHEPEQVGANVARSGQDRRGRIVDRGCPPATPPGRCTMARPRDRAHQGGARRDRCRQQRRAADRGAAKVFWSASPISTW